MGYRRKRQEKKRLRKLLENGGPWYSIYHDRKTGRLIRNYPYSRGHPGIAKYWRKQTNRRLRGMKELFQRGLYKRVLEYDWVLF